MRVHQGTARGGGQVIASRETFDGKRVELWSDGDLTWAFGHAIRGVRLPRSGDLSVGWAVLGELELFTAQEVPTLIKSAQRGGLPGEIRTRAHTMLRRARKEGRVPRPNLVWQVLEADWEGRPKTRVAKLPRILFGPGLAIWNERGRYDVVVERPLGSDVYESTGISVRTLGAALDAAAKINV